MGCNTLKIDDNLLRLANNRFHHIYAMDHLQCIQSKVYSLVGKSEPAKKIGRIITMMSQDHDKNIPPSIQSVREAIADVEIDAELEMLLDDYEYYLKNKKLRRKEAGCSK